MAIKIPISPNYSYEGVSSDIGPCVVCGREVKTARYFVHEHNGGGLAVTEEEAEQMDEYADDMGLQPIGPDCLRKHPELKPYVWGA